MSLKQRILDRMTVEDRGYRTPCWISDRVTQSNGYTKIGVNGATLLTHRAAYEAFVGPIPVGKVIDHLCRQRTCCNPDHLEPVSNRENLLRGEGLCAVAARMTTCAAGHEFEGANLRVTAKGKRVCKACDALRARSYRQRRRAPL